MTPSVRRIPPKSKVQPTPAAPQCAGKGDSLVFVSGGKVYKVADQAKLKGHAGHKVTISGKVDGDMLTVDKVTM